MSQLERLDHKSLVQMNVRNRKALRNAEMAWNRVGGRLIATVAGAGAAYAAGAFMHSATKQGKEEGTLGGTEDPTKLAGIDKDLAAGLGITLLGVLASGKKGKIAKFGQYIEAAGTGILSGYAYTLGYSMAGDADAGYLQTRGQAAAA